MQYIPEDKISKAAIPKNLIHNYYNDGPLKGQLTFLSITDRYEYEIAFKENRIFSMSVITEKNGAVRTETDCIDWFLVTYYFNSDGTYSTTEEFVGRTCGGGNCANVECLDPNGDGSGSSPGGGDGSEYEYSRDMSWTVIENPSNSSGQIVSGEKIKGRRVASEPQGGHFRSIIHYTSTCNFCSSSNPNDVWVETANSVYASGQAASSSVTGNLNYAGTYYPNISNTKTWSFQQVFP